MKKRITGTRKPKEPRNWGHSTVNLPFLPRSHGSTRHLIFSQSDMVLTDPSVGGGYSFSLSLVSYLWLLCNHRINSELCFMVNKADFLFCVVMGSYFFLFFSGTYTYSNVYCMLLVPCPNPLLVHPFPSCCINWLLTAHSCTLPCSRDLPRPSGQHSSEMSGRFCTIPSWEGRQPETDWYVHINAQPPFLKREQPFTLQSLPWDQAEARRQLNPHLCLLSFLPYTASLTLLHVSFESKSLNKFFAQESASQVLLL